MEGQIESPRQCFVVSPIGEQGTERFETFRRVLDRMIRPAVEESSLDLQVIRADEIHRPGSFIRDVLEYLAGAYLVIVDLTGQNANVFYELGVRHALSPRTILIARAATEIPADLREYRTLIYSDSSDSDESFRKTLRSYLEEIERAPDTPDNPVMSHLKPPQIPNDLRKTFAARLADAGGTQEDILRFIRKVSGPTGATVGQAALAQKFKTSAPEMYYRLEQLRLLGFITKERGVGDGFDYRLASDYRRELGLPDIVVSLSLVSTKGKSTRFGESADAPRAYFYYVKAANERGARIRKLRILASRVRLFDEDSTLIQDYGTPIQLKWHARQDRCAPADVAMRDVAIANVGFFIENRGFFQLDVCPDPWPPGFPGRLEPRRRMRLDLVADVSGSPALAELSLDIAWDGSWNADAAAMERHLVIAPCKRD